MLQIRDICKEYRTASLVQKALDKVSLNLRDNEFVAILGPSGSGKTTLLNIIGGLDRYDSGDLIINGISTKKYKDRDWDSYRNHTIGFVFQSYNLIPHQTLLANVELALTISGVGKAERKRRAENALDQVGLKEQMHKKPNQLSGGQMQRVAIARALVNDPDILLADEPTGALDSETSVQVMELLKEVARDRLVVMVTHNPELAQEYATRIVNLKDGRIVSDSDAFMINEGKMEIPEHRNMGKASISFLTALSLSFNNLRTKKARTLLTSFAGSIGIIGIALILSLSTGVNQYIESVEEETLSEYPLQIQSTGIDFGSMMGSSVVDKEDKEKSGDIHVIQMMTNMFSTVDSNDLESLKKYLDSGESRIEDYTNAIEYSYDVTPQIYSENGEDIRQVHPDRSFELLGLGSASGSNSMMSSMMSTDIFYEMPADESLYEDQYDVKAGRWPQSYNECVLVLTSGGGISDFMLYTLGLRDSLELEEMIDQFINEETIKIPEDIGEYSYEDIVGKTFRLVNSADYYEYDSQYQIWKDKTGDKDYMHRLVDTGEILTVVGVVQPSEDATAAMLTTGIGYPSSLTEHVVEQASQKEIVKQQTANPGVNVFTNEPFGEDGGENTFDMQSLITVDEKKIEEAFGFDENAFSGLSDSLDLSGVFGPAGGSVDLSGMIDLGDITISFPGLPPLDFSDIVGDLEITASPEGMEKLLESLTEGYQNYVDTHPDADYSGLEAAFENYLTTAEAQVILKENIGEIIRSEGTVSIAVEDLKAMGKELIEGYQAYIQGNPPDQTVDAYLETVEAVQILNAYADKIFGGITDNVAITDDQIQTLSSEIMSGYRQYAAAGNGPDPSAMSKHFITYLGTPDGQMRLAAGVAGLIDMESLGRQISDAVATYVQETMAVYGSAMGQAIEEQVSSVMEQLAAQLASGMESALTQSMTQAGQSLQNAVNIDADAFADAFEMNLTEEELMELMMSMNSGERASYAGNLKTLGYADFGVPSGIDIYPKDFESKEQVISILDGYNDRMEAQGKEEQVITYTDVVGTLMSSVTDIIDIISYVLIAFVAISLVVSSIMIGVITYISVLERKKEIGILRAIGASKGNISQVFNAETFIIGLCSGLMGIGLSLIILIPGNMLVHYLAGTDDVSAVLPAVPAVILILLSVVLTLIGGLIPSKKAAKSDPVTALRTE